MRVLTRIGFSAPPEGREASAVKQKRIVKMITSVSIGISARANELLRSLKVAAAPTGRMPVQYAALALSGVGLQPPLHLPEPLFIRVISSAVTHTLVKPQRGPIRRRNVQPDDRRLPTAKVELCA